MFLPYVLFLLALLETFEEMSLYENNVFATILQVSLLIRSKMILSESQICMEMFCVFRGSVCTIGAHGLDDGPQPSATPLGEPPRQAGKCSRQDAGRLYRQEDAESVNLRQMQAQGLPNIRALVVLFSAHLCAPEQRAEPAGPSALCHTRTAASLMSNISWAVKVYCAH